METGEGDQGDSELSEVGVELIGKAEAASNTGESRGDQVVKDVLKSLRPSYCS